MQADDPAAALGQALADEAARVQRELDEIQLLIGQARMEAERHEARRAAAELHVSEVPGAQELRDAATSLVTATRRTALMEGQIEVLEGKHKSAARLHERLVAVAEALGALPAGALEAAGREAVSLDEADLETSEPAGTTPARAVLDAQEDLRRDIARAMHDGPAQSLTNIILQAQIVGRLVAEDPSRAQLEVAQLVNMVQQTLEATKTFIFDVRPMVLDDLGLVPTLRRVARDRGRRTQVPIAFDSVGADRRLPAERESALFRIVDEALVGYLRTEPRGVEVRLDWGEREVRAEVRARPNESAGEPSPVAVLPPKAGPRSPEDLPPVLAAMIQEQQAVSEASAAAATVARARERALPEAVWEGIRVRAAASGIRVALLDDGAVLSASAALVD